MLNIAYLPLTSPATDPFWRHAQYLSFQFLLDVSDLRRLNSTFLPRAKPASASGNGAPVGEVRCKK